MSNGIITWIYVFLIIFGVVMNILTLKLKFRKPEKVAKMKKVSGDKNE